MRREHNLTPDQIKRVEIGLHRNGITLTGDAATKRHPTSIVGGQFSMFFTGALALDQGRFGWDDYERLGDAAVNALADKFDVVQDDRLEIGRTHPFGARVSITTEDGVHERLYADPSGEPNSFPDAQAMQQKFLTLARPVLNGRADQLADAILSLERIRSRREGDPTRPAIAPSISCCLRAWPCCRSRPPCRARGRTRHRPPAASSASGRAARSPAVPTE